MVAFLREAVHDKKKRMCIDTTLFLRIRIELHVKFVWLFVRIEFSTARLNCSADRVAGGSTKSTLI